MLDIMQTVAVEQLPDALIKKYGSTIPYKVLESYILRKKLSQIKKFFYNEESDSY